MPAKSRAQYRLFKYLEKHKEEAKRRGISEQTIKDYTENMSKEKFKNLRETIRKRNSK